MKGYWDEFIEIAKNLEAPLYARLAEGMKGDPELRAFAARAKEGQPEANILFGAVHFLFLEGAQDPLRDFYPTLNGGAARRTGDPFPEFRDFVLRHQDKLAPIVENSVTNTNEVARAGLIAPGFRVLAEQTGDPLYLVEVGPSAGLNMIWDKYNVRYTREGQPVSSNDGVEGNLDINIALRGKNIPPTGAAPRVSRRIGLELNPVDLADPVARQWLRALVWPDHPERMERLDKALAVYDSMKERPEIRHGDALDLLPEALAGAAAGETLCVYHTVVTYQFSDNMKAGLEDVFLAASRRRPVWRLSVEGDASASYPLLLSKYQNGQKETEQVLALCSPHGKWMEWRA